MSSVDRERWIRHVWTVGDFKLGLLHASEDDFGFENGAVVRQGSIFGFGGKRFSLWRYVVTSEYVILRAGRITMKARVHEAGLGIKFVRVPYLGYLVVDKLRVRAPFSGEEKIIKEAVLTKSLFL